MGRIIQKATLQNAIDLGDLQRGHLQQTEVHEADVEFIVDTGAAMICLPPELIAQLDLYETHQRRVITANGEVTRRVYSPVRITIEDREADLNVMELPPDTPPLLGYLPLEALDLYPNPLKQCLEGNPKYDGKMVMDLLLCQ